MYFNKCMTTSARSQGSVENFGLSPLFQHFPQDLVYFNECMTKSCVITIIILHKFNKRTAKTKKMLEHNCTLSNSLITFSDSFTHLIKMLDSGLGQIHIIYHMLCVMPGYKLN